MMPLDGTVITPQISDAYQPFLKPSRYKAVKGGRGSGKSHFFAQAAVVNCAAVLGTRVVCIREVQKTLRESAKRLIEDKIETLGAKGFKVKNDEIETPGGGVIIFNGMQDHTAQSIKSLEGFKVAWVEEAQTLSKTSLELLRPTIRIDDSEIWASWNPRSAGDPIDAFFSGEHPPENAIIRHINFDQNPWFTSVLKAERIYDFESNPHRYAHIWLGEYEPMVAGAIWDRATLHANRRREAPQLERILVGVDPAITSPETNARGTPDYHGIGVAALGADDRGYVLEDASRQGGPKDWAERTIATFDKWEADAVVVEVNQGGDMVKHTLQSYRRELPIIEVRATRGKHVRAEPISALYKLNRISHVGTHRELEDQLCRFTNHGYEGPSGESPDRAEAIIWALSELFPALTQSTQKMNHEENFPVVEGAWMG